MDYDFYLRNAIEKDHCYIVSMENLLLMCIFGMGVEKYYNDLKLIEKYFTQKYMNKEYLIEQEKYLESYKKKGGIIYGGKY